jgi:uncharacterized repeat protein (TIGR03803 family)
MVEAVLQQTPQHKTSVSPLLLEARHSITVETGTLPPLAPTACPNSHDMWRENNKMKDEKIVLATIAYSQRLKSFPMSAALMLTTLMLVVAATAGATAQTFKMLHSFDGKDGANPSTGLVQATDGNLYGTTDLGGTHCGRYGCGTVFKITPSGRLTTLHSFDRTDGELIYGALVQASNGDLYGTTYGGGANNYGTVFKITTSGRLTTVHNFVNADGSEPTAGMVQASNGDLYGTTSEGGAYGNYGTVFKITPGGKLTTLYSFCSQSNCTDGETPYAALVQASNGDLYGTTNSGGADGYGTVFKITLGGTLTLLHAFTGKDGANPVAGLVQDTNGAFYGTTHFGGDSTDCYTYGGCGTVFSLFVGLGPFVELQTTSGKVGAAVKILGTSLTGATSVSFNGTVAVFKVVSGSLIKTTVPTGATTGTVDETTLQGTLYGNVAFRVTK